MENFLIEWALLAWLLLASIGLYNSLGMKYGWKTLIFFPDSIWPQAEWFVWTFFIVPLILLSCIYWID